MKHAAPNIDPAELHKFDQLASRWWDPDSEFKPLHDINPLRLDYIDRRARLAGKQVCSALVVHEFQNRPLGRQLRAADSAAFDPRVYWRLADGSSDCLHADADTA